MPYLRKAGGRLLPLCLVCLTVSGEPTLDFGYFVARVQPVFVRKRPGSGRCYDCHSAESNKARFHLQPLVRDGWTEEQARRNFANAVSLVTPGEPLKSRLLTHPLAEDAGGDEFHSGGKFWNSQEDPEWQTLARWVQGAREK
jgi:hypothetical protein